MRTVGGNQTARRPREKHGLIIVALVATIAAARPGNTLRYDALVSAGHEGRPESCAHFPTHRCNLGTPGERQWTPVVADEITRVLRAHGVSVAREPADFAGEYEVKTAVFIHFDGNDRPCSTGASIGYHDAASVPAAQKWRTDYSKYFPFRFMPDNFTNNLRDYYAFRQVRGTQGSLVIELGEITCPAQRRWLGPRLQWAGDLIAQFMLTQIGK